MAVIQTAEAADGEGYERRMLANSAQFRRLVVATTTTWTDRQEGGRQVDEMTMEAKIQATRVDLTSPTVHPTLGQCRKKCAHITTDRNEREHHAQALFKYSGRLYCCSGALPAMHGYEFDIELAKGLMKIRSR